MDYSESLSADSDSASAEPTFDLSAPTSPTSLADTMSAEFRDHLASHVVVWIARVSQHQGSLSTLDPFLDERDRLRSARYKFADDRARFVLGRALVRTFLGRHLQLAPGKIELALSTDGRPYYPHDDSIRFNLTHSGDLVGLAVTTGAAVGIDIERVESHPDLAELAQRIFSEKDLETFRSFSSAEALPAFFRAWTRKEAYLKARGEGIAEGLPQISTSFSTEDATDVNDFRHPSPSGTWRLFSLCLPAGYAGCLACDGPEKQLAAQFGRIVSGQFVAESVSLLK